MRMVNRLPSETSLAESMGDGDYPRRRQHLVGEGVLPCTHSNSNESSKQEGNVSVVVNGTTKSTATNNREALFSPLRRRVKNNHQHQHQNTPKEGRFPNLCSGKNATMGAVANNRHHPQAQSTSIGGIEPSSSSSPSTDTPRYQQHLRAKRNLSMSSVSADVSLQSVEEDAAAAAVAAAPGAVGGDHSHSMGVVSAMPSLATLEENNSAHKNSARRSLRNRFFTKQLSHTSLTLKQRILYSKRKVKFASLQPSSAASNTEITGGPQRGSGATRSLSRDTSKNTCSTTSSGDDNPVRISATKPTAGDSGTKRTDERNSVEPAVVTQPTAQDFTRDQTKEEKEDSGVYNREQERKDASTSFSLSSAPPHRRSLNKRQASVLKGKNLVVRSWLARSKFFRNLCDSAFVMVDADQSGTIDEQELYSGLLLIHLQLGSYLGQAACQPLERERCNAIFRMVDINQSGGLDKEEFVDVMMVLFSNVLVRVLLQWSLTLLVVPVVAQKLLDSWYSFFVSSRSSSSSSFGTNSSTNFIVGDENDQAGGWMVTVVGWLGALCPSLVASAFWWTRDQLFNIMSYFPDVFHSIPLSILTAVLGVSVVPWIIFKLDDLFHDLANRVFDSPGIKNNNNTINNATRSSNEKNKRL